MTARRIRFGGCSFIPPEGFSLQEKASIVHSDASCCRDRILQTKPTVSITLINTVTHPDVPDYSESPEDMNPDAYPPTLTLSTVPGHGNASPLNYLRNTGEVLKSHFKDFKEDFCRNEMLGKFPAACSQESFLTNFRIFRLNFAWLINEILMTSTMTVTESKVEKGWTDLRKFVASVQF